MITMPFRWLHHRLISMCPSRDLITDNFGLCIQRPPSPSGLFTFAFLLSPCYFLCKSIRRSASCAMIAAGCQLKISPGTLDIKMKRKQTMLSPFPRKWLGAAFALALLVASFTNTFAQQKQEQEKAEPLTIGSTISTVL